MVPCSYRSYVRPHRVPAPPARPLALSVKRDEPSAAPPVTETQGPPATDAAPHVALVREYAW